MPYAANDQISHNPIEDGIKITDEQYITALNGMMSGLVVKVIDGELRVEEADAPEPEPEVDPTFGALVMARLASLSTRRFEEEVGGTFFSGLPIKTDRETCSIITAAYVSAINDPAYMVSNWKIADGMFITLDATTIIALAQTVRAHIQGTFDQEAEISALILAATTKEELDAIDVW